MHQISSVNLKIVCLIKAFITSAFFIFILPVSQINAQSPPWVSTVPNSNFYTYGVGVAQGDTKENIRRKALTDAMAQIAMRLNISVQGLQEMKSLVVEKDGAVQTIDSLTSTVNVSYDNISLEGLEIIDEHVDKRTNRSYLLVRLRTPHASGVEDKEALRIKSARRKVLWKSLLIPGSGHRYMGYKKRADFWAYSFLGTTLLSGISFLSSSYFENRAAAEVQINRKNFLNNISTNLYYSGFSFIGMAGVTYITSIITAKMKAKRFFGNSLAVTNNGQFTKARPKALTDYYNCHTCSLLKIQISL